ncbi:MAG: universal stress protein [Bacteroidia bacterium]|nr:universal stress protein [Bacteroidia bacterium]MDW8346013.1 universal stress protein [Bacteroidia bacterium]
MFKKVLSPIDFSAEAVEYAHYARQLAQKLNASLFFIHSIQGDYKQYGVDNKSDRSVVLQAVQHKFDVWRKTYHFEEITPIITFGEITECIAEQAELHNIDLVVMFTRGLDEEEWLGTNTTKVAKIAPCPVLSVKSIKGQPDFKRILLPIDPKLTVEGLSTYALEFIKLMQAEVDLIYVGEESENSRTVLEKYTKLYQDAGISAQFNFVDREDSVTETIISYSQKKDFQLIIMATHARMGIKALILGSVTENCINNAPIPVMTLKA